MFWVALSLGHCKTLVRIVGVCYVIGIPSTCALFFFRVTAVYHNKFVTMFFGFLLFGLFCVSWIIPVAVVAEELGTTKRCFPTEIKSFGSTPGILDATFDTLVFIAISYRIVSLSMVGDTFGARLRSFFRGDGLSSFLKSVLQGGQLYYLYVVNKQPISSLCC
jgi:hypothetical protein